MLGTRQRRDTLFAAAADVLDGAVLTPRHPGYPVLTGKFHGFPVSAEPMVDTMTLRKLPTLWLTLTIRCRLDVSAPLDILLDPNGTEFFSPNTEFPVTLPAPHWLDTHARLATTAQDHHPVDVLDRLRPLLRDGSLKEVLVNRGGLRLVHRIAEAHQSAYRTTRRAEFDAVTLDAGWLRDTLGIATATAAAHRAGGTP